MFYCPLHNWYSSEEPCKACYKTYTTITTATTSPIPDTPEQTTKEGFVWDRNSVLEFAELYHNELLVNQQRIKNKDWNIAFTTIEEFEASKQSLSNTPKYQYVDSNMNLHESDAPISATVKINTPKEEQPAKDKDYEIVSYRMIGSPLHILTVSDCDKDVYQNKSCLGEVWHKDKISKDKRFEVKSVRRLSDGEVFSVGDEVFYLHKFDKKKHDFVIGAFSIENNNECLVWAKDPPSYLKGVPYCNLSSLKKLPSTKPAEPSQFDIYTSKENNDFLKKSIEEKLKEEQPSKERIENEPCLSVNDVYSFLCSYYDLKYNIPNHDILIGIAKQKLSSTKNKQQ